MLTVVLTEAGEAFWTLWPQQWPSLKPVVVARKPNRYWWKLSGGLKWPPTKPIVGCHSDVDGGVDRSWVNHFGPCDLSKWPPTILGATSSSDVDRNLINHSTPEEVGYASWHIAACSCRFLQPASTCTTGSKWMQMQDIECSLVTWLMRKCVQPSLTLLLTFVLSWLPNSYVVGHWLLNKRLWSVWICAFLSFTLAVLSLKLVGGLLHASGDAIIRSIVLRFISLLSSDNTVLIAAPSPSPGHDSAFLWARYVADWSWGLMAWSIQWLLFDWLVTSRNEELTISLASHTYKNPCTSDTCMYTPTPTCTRPHLHVHAHICMHTHTNTISSFLHESLLSEDVLESSL